MKMIQWAVDFAYRKGGKYEESRIYVIAVSALGAINEANMVLNSRAYKDGWDMKDTGDRFMIWNVGIMLDADEKVF